MDLLLTLLFALLLLLGIVGFCTVFTNAVEWLGHRLHLSEGVVGSVFAAVGTALPETLVPIVAILSGVLAGGNMSPETAGEIGVGAILGAPFMLATLAMFIVGLTISLLSRGGGRPYALLADPKLMRTDLTYFFLAFGLSIAATFVPLGWGRYAVAVALLVVYALYLRDIFSHSDELGGEEEHNIAPLFLARRNPDPALPPILAQVVLGLLGIVAMAHLFVHEVEHLSHILHMDPLILSLIVVPIATELPEKFNSVLWVREQKDQLAMGNLTGAMVFQSCIPTAIGVAFTAWAFTPSAWASVALCSLSAAIMLVGMRTLPQSRWVPLLLLGGVFYAAFLVIVFTRLGGA